MSCICAIYNFGIEMDIQSTSPRNWAQQVGKLVYVNTINLY
jgi:hypothetical protein